MLKTDELRAQCYSYFAHFSRGFFTSAVFRHKQIRIKCIVFNIRTLTVSLCIYNNNTSIKTWIISFVCSHRPRTKFRAVSLARFQSNFNQVTQVCRARFQSDLYQKQKKNNNNNNNKKTKTKTETSDLGQVYLGNIKVYMGILQFTVRYRLLWTFSRPKRLFRTVFYVSRWLKLLATFVARFSPFIIQFSR